MAANAYGIHWFRRDLRITGNPALRESFRRHNGRVVGVFFFDKTFLQRPDFSHNRFGFFLKTLAALRQEFLAWGGDLLVLDTPPAHGFAQLFSLLASAKEPAPKSVSFNRDYEPFALARDEEVSEFIAMQGIEVISSRDHLILEPEELKRPDGGTYQVFTPFAKRWFAAPALMARCLAAPNERRPKEVFTLRWQSLLGSKLPPDQLQGFIDANSKHCRVVLPEAGAKVAAQILADFVPKVTKYSIDRDKPSIQGTSKLAMYLKNGSITTSQIFAKLGISSATMPFLRQLVWREFYYHVLYWHPEVEKEAFHRKYRALAWQNRSDWFEAWKLGQTGFPLIDAGMRQLLQTGEMPNRVRMVVASFLTKDLLVDWRWGEQWFMQNLLDGDLAANNGGWQWAASTGCDPVPYFRVFNPELQSRKFDPDGAYIKRWLPELASLSSKDVHAPPPLVRPKSYPLPIVNHAVQKELAVALFKRD